MFKIGLVGATNVGKSTLFNRLIGQFRAIVTDVPGTTVDIIYHEMEIDGIGKVAFGDSPGLLEFDQERVFIKKIIDESDLILFVIDDTVGITAKEHSIYSYIMEKNKGKQTLLVVNKLDVNYKSNQIDLAIADYYELGIENIIGISAKNELNITEIEDFIVNYFKDKKASLIKGGGEGNEQEGLIPPTPLTEGGQSSQHEEEKPIPIAIIGKPNVGKSTLLNFLVGKELAKVEDYLGTTRDYITGDFEYKGQKYRVYDTAGLRKKGSIHGIEKIAYDKIKGMLEYVRPCIIFMIDGAEGVTHRDMTLLAEINNLALPIMVAVNKMDLLDSKQKKQIQLSVQANLDYAKYIPIVPIVAKEGKGVNIMLDMLGDIISEAEKRIDTNELNKAINTEMIKRPPRFPKNKICKLYYITQIDINAPTFVAFINKKERANFAFKKRIENSIRNNFGFVGTPIVIRFKEKSRDSE